MRNADLLEWIDPVTEEKHTCPREFVNKLQQCLVVGRANAKLAGVLLEEMGVPPTEANRRHLRQATFILRRLGLPVVSLRSQKGGYYVAASREEVYSFTSEQRKLAASMIREASNLDRIEVGGNNE